MKSFKDIARDGRCKAYEKYADGGGLYANIHAKQERIKHGSGEKMRKPGAPGAPTAEAFEQSAKTRSDRASGGRTPAWQRAEGKNPAGGLNEKGRRSYHQETGGTLKRPQPEGGPRKRSFCARMTGMRKKLTSAKTAHDPNSRINKSLRAWNC
jgi:transcription elongation factor